MAEDDIRTNERGESTTVSVGARMTGAQAKSAANILRAGTTAGSGLGKLGKAQTGMPKQEDGESPSAYGERLRKWREGSPAIDGQKKALQAMSK